jgi:hypothetical protein
MSSLQSNVYELSVTWFRFTTVIEYCECGTMAHCGRPGKTISRYAPRLHAQCVQHNVAVPGRPQRVTVQGHVTCVHLRSGHVTWTAPRGGRPGTATMRDTQAV